MTTARSYLVRTGSEATARAAARQMAKREGHRDPNGTIVYVERIERGVYEVAIEEPER